MRKIKALIVTVIAYLCCIAASAHSFEVDGIYYNITSSSDLTVAVTYRGSNSDSYSNEYSGSVVIPEKVTYNSKKYSVTSIRVLAFANCSDLTSVSIPNSVTSIEQSAFYGCSGLTSVTISNSVTSIGKYAFRGCSGLTSVAIPNSVTSIGGSAFYGCSGLTAVHISDLSAWCKIKFIDRSSNPTSYAHHLYLNDKEITNLVIPDNITSIGNYAFYGCSGLTSVTIPNSVTSIGIYAFYRCSGLTSVTIPNSVTSIGGDAFFGCSGLTSVIIPNSVTSIGISAFYGCSGLTSVTIPNSVTSIGGFAFYGCSSLTSVTIPNSVTSIEGSAFEGCSSLTSVIIPNSVTSIEGSAFEGCSGLTSVTIPNSVTSIGSGAFSGCSGLTSVTIGNSVTSIGREAFHGCELISQLDCKAAIPPLADYPFSNNIYSIATLYVPEGSAGAYKNAEVWGKFMIVKEHVDVDSVVLNVNSIEMVEGEASILTAIVLPEDATDKTITWTSSDESIAKVSENGVVTALKPGKVTITASSKVCPTVTATCEITVNTKISSITLNKTAADIVEGESLVLTATVSPEDATDKSVTWISSDESIAKISENGVVTALKAGIAIITASSKVCPTVTATCEITVNTKISAITLNKAAAEIVEGESLVLTATVSPEDATDKSVTWISSDESIAKISENGVVTALKAGRAIITASSKVCPTVTATCEVVVKAKTVTVTGITLDKTTAEITEGETLTLTATVSPENATDKTVTWISSDESIVKVINGIVIGVKAGKATIIASCGDKVATCEITVNAKVIPTTGITLDKTTAELTEGETLTLTATVTPEDAIDKTVVWASSDETVATVKDGVVTALKAGKVTITAKAGEVSATCEITVNAKVIPATGITLDKTTAEMTEGETLTLTATVTPENATGKTVVWTSSDETVATVANGVVTALKAGKVTIMVTSTSNPSVNATCEITVNAKVIPATGIALDKTTAELTEGETLTLTATVTPENATDKTVVWTSSDETVATVKDGVVTALKAGKAAITAKSGEVSATCEITVNAKVIPATGISLDKTTAEMIEGETLTLTATVTPEDATDKTVAWTSSDETVATVVDGVVTALKAGKATITAKAGEVSATCELTVNAKVIPATGIALDKTTAELTEGETLTLTATVTPEDATDKTVAWTSSDETVATVKDGVVTALKAGKVTITAKTGEVSATCELTVNAKVIPATSIALDKTTAEMIEGETLILTATVTPENATDKTVVWTSSDETVATVANGVVTALKAGKATITAKSGEVSATCEITVNAKVIPATGITLDKTAAELTEGETLTLTATVSPEDATDKTVTWASSDEAVVKVVNGVVSALKTGKATITATSGDVSATCEITVIPVTGINGVIYSDGYAAGNVYTVAGNLVCRKGEKLSNLPKGLYIVDGKKIVVK